MSRKAPLTSFLFLSLALISVHWVLSLPTIWANLGLHSLTVGSLWSPVQWGKENFGLRTRKQCRTLLVFPGVPDQWDLHSRRCIEFVLWSLRTQGGRHQPSRVCSHFFILFLGGGECSTKNRPWICLKNCSLWEYLWYSNVENDCIMFAVMCWKFIITMKSWQPTFIARVSFSWHLPS